MEILSQQGAAFSEIRSQINSTHEDNDKGSAKAAHVQPKENSLETKEDSIYTQGAQESDLPATDVFEARTDRVSTPLHTEMNPNKKEMTPLDEKQQELSEQTKAADIENENSQNTTKFQEQVINKKAQDAYISQSKTAQWNYNTLFKS